MNNVVKDYTDFILKQFCFYAKNIMGKYYIDSIFKELVKEYINIRYYNIYPPKQNNKTTIIYYLNLKIKDLCLNNKSKIKNITFMVDIFNYLINLNSDIEANEVNRIEKELENLRKEKYDLEDEIEFSKEYREFKKSKNNFLASYETEDFYIEYKKTKEKNLYNTTLKHNLKMPELYSDKAIDNAFNNGLIKEDKLFVLYNLIAIKVLNEIINYDYNSCYLIEFNDSLFKKKEKLNRLLKIINNDITKEKVCFKITNKILNDNNKEIFKLINEGYNFAIIKDESYEKSEYDTLFKYVLDKEV